MKLLRRFGLVGPSPQIKKNISKLRQRQQQQLSLLEPLRNKVDKNLLNSKLQDLAKMNDQTVFNTFTVRCLNPQVQNLNALADVNIERVFEKQAHKKIPFTVKDHLKVEGMIETCGFADNLTPSKVSSDIVELLERQGCIAFAHSNVPQGLLGIKSENPVFGRTYNPHNPKFLSGGSSGGQGALVASKACAFGLGSDSGGSARIPAAFCGTYGFKPTGSKRFSPKGRVGPSGIQGIKIGDIDPCFGFLTRHFDDLPWLCSKTIGKNIVPYDPVLYGEWDQARYEAAKRKKLTVGYIYTNHEMKVAPGIVNSIQETIEALKADKHKVVEFNFPKLHLFRNFFFEFVFLSGFLNGMFHRMEGHPPNLQAAQFYDLHLFGRLGVWLKSLRNDCDVEKQVKSMYRKVPSRKEFFKIHKQIDDVRKEFYKEWHEKGIDIILSPVMPFTAPLPGTTDLLVYQLAYSCYQNILQLPAGSIPTRPVKEEETKYTPVTSFEKKAAPSIWASKGLPTAIQVTGRHLGDQECLGAMYQINKLVGNCIDPTFGMTK